MHSKSAPLVTPDLVLGAVFLILALVFPVLFHLAQLGSTFLPMFFPIALAGFLLQPTILALLGISAPLISGALTGMPPFYPPVAPQMAVEGLVLGVGIAVLHQRLKLGIYPSLVLGLLLQRIVLVLVVFVIAPLFHLPPEIYSMAKLVSGIPGVLLQLILIPPLVVLIKPRILKLKELS